MQVLVDDREPPVVLASLEALSVDARVGRLLVGDVHVLHNNAPVCVVERKSFSDLFASLNSGRMVAQLQDLEASPLDTWLIVERGPIHHPTVPEERATQDNLLWLIRVATRQTKTRILCVSSTCEFAYVIRSLTRDTHSKCPLAWERRTRKAPCPYEAFLTSIGGIGTAKARRIKACYPCIRALCEADIESDMALMDAVGKKALLAMVAALHPAPSSPPA
jgi:ERCC4-type nuclease